jgi:hypothetical protein
MVSEWAEKKQGKRALERVGGGTVAQLFVVIRVTAIGSRSARVAHGLSRVPSTSTHTRHTHTTHDTLTQVLTCLC